MIAISDRLIFISHARYILRLTLNGSDFAGILEKSSHNNVIFFSSIIDIYDFEQILNVVSYNLNHVAFTSWKLTKNCCRQILFDIYNPSPSKNKVWSSRYLKKEYKTMKIAWFHPLKYQKEIQNSQ